METLLFLTLVAALLGYLVAVLLSIRKVLAHPGASQQRRLLALVVLFLVPVLGMLGVWLFPKMLLQA